MISVSRAKKLVLKNTPQFGIVSLPLEEAGGLVLAEDVYARYDVPPFTNSAMDGYAVKSFETKGATERSPAAFKLSGLTKAGSFPKGTLGKGEVVKIMTGAPLSARADSVVIIEDTAEENGSVLVKQEVIPGENVRFQGEEISKDSLALRKSTFLNPAAIGFLASIGIKKAKIYRTPKVTIVITGNEVISPGNKLEPGKIFDSNSVSLQAALRECGIQEAGVLRAEDNASNLERVLEKALSGSDIVLISGGVSVGDFDYVKQTLNGLKVKEIFWKVAQRPGKPLYFGKKRRTLIFGIPGNPAASLVVFYEYIRPAILKSMGRKYVYLPTAKVRIAEKIKKKKNLTYFWRGSLNRDRATVTIPEQQGSHMLKSFALGDCLIVGPRNKSHIRKNNLIEVHLLLWRN